MIYIMQYKICRMATSSYGTKHFRSSERCCFKPFTLTSCRHELLCPVKVRQRPLQGQFINNFIVLGLHTD